jgi:hypothetical protein
MGKTLEIKLKKEICNAWLDFSANPKKCYFTQNTCEYPNKIEFCPRYRDYILPNKRKR